jgi:2-keto-4-pentenoate hydratase/2-oxohepta-3-ene-1,7-dioic acid hydratase in catechol pathway
MKLVRFRTDDPTIHSGVIEGDLIRVIRGDICGAWQETGRRVPLQDATLLSPIDPVNIFCFGKNYKAHAEEGGEAAPEEPILFMKSTSCVIGPGAPIMIPAIAPSTVDYEAELAVIIKRAARNVPRVRALDYVLGYTCANDVSARDCQIKDGQWCRAKSFESFGPLGPWIETELDPRNLRVQGILNGKVMQSASTATMIFDVAYLIHYLSKGMTLLPGTVLLTGTPAGCGFAQQPPLYLRAGDVFQVEVEGIGLLQNPVTDEPAKPQH